MNNNEELKLFVERSRLLSDLLALKCPATSIQYRDPYITLSIVGLSEDVVVYTGDADDYFDVLAEILRNVNGMKNGQTDSPTG
jgi:hypothetical protein